MHERVSMKVVAEKMLQMRGLLKSAREFMGPGFASARRRVGTIVRLPAPVENWLARHRRIGRVLRIAGIAAVVYLAMPYILMPIFRFVDPPFSALMVRQAVTGVDVRHKWVDFEDISPSLVRAVVLAEDASFCRHWGIDWSAVGDALDRVEEGESPRGASTLPMQTAKNLFLWPGQDYFRKALEVPIAYYMSLTLPKQRVVEIYLNIAEWGPGIFGVEAAARYHFGKSAAALTPREASLLAAALPSPIRRKAGRPRPKLLRIASHIQARATREAHDVACVFD